jgi:hypothetical protein
MAKGQKKSNREVRKPKRTAAETAKASAVKISSQVGGESYKERFRKSVIPNR